MKRGVLQKYLRKHSQTRFQAANPQGQVALEFIVTYGWALLAILATLWILTYYGYLDFSRYLSDYCDLGPQLQCVDFRLKADPPAHPGGFDINIRSNFPVSIKIHNIQVYLDGQPVVNYDVESIVGDSSSLAPGEETSFNSYTLDNPNPHTNPNMPRWDSNLPLSIGSKQAIDIVFNISQNISGAPTHLIRGRIFSKVVQS